MPDSAIAIFPAARPIDYSRYVVASLIAVCCLLISLPGLASAVEQEAETPTVPVNQRGFLGVHVIPRSDFSGAMEIRQVIPSTTAAEAGIKLGDQLISVNGIATTKRSDLRRVLSMVAIGGEITFVIERNGERQNLVTTLRGVPNHEDLNTMIKLLREENAALEQQVAALRDQLAGVNTPLPAVEQAVSSRAELAAQLIALNQTLSLLPTQLNATAQEFHQIYPEGVFRIHLDIDIRTGSDENSLVDLSPTTVEELSEEESLPGGTSEARDMTKGEDLEGNGDNQDPVE